MALFRRKTSTEHKSLEESPLDIDYAMAVVNAHARQLENRELEPELECAVFSDQMRDAGILPLTFEKFEQTTQPLDNDDWRRFALACRIVTENSAAVKAIFSGSVESTLAVFVQLAIDKQTHTIELMRQSAIRQEEFARTLAARLRWPIENESPEEGVQRLRQIDYSRLLQEADEARGTAEERMEFLRKLQAKEAARQARRRRGKW